LPGMSLGAGHSAASNLPSRRCRYLDTSWAAIGDV
jgi:hypothetical protein